jgi:hypothetical protein
LKQLKLIVELSKTNRLPAVKADIKNNSEVLEIHGTMKKGVETRNHNSGRGLHEIYCSTRE